MNRRPHIILLLVALILSCADASAFLSRKSKTAATSSLSFESEIKPFLNEYCFSCHSDAKRKADLSLEGFTDESTAIKERDIWEKVLLNLRSGEMPPSNKPQPSLDQREKVMQWVETTVLRADCSNPDPGRVTIRRLNRNEYNNTIRDLVGVDFQPAEDFPNDDTGYGFDNIGDVLSLPPVLFERYMAAAEKILDVAIVTDPNAKGPSVRILGSKMRDAADGNVIRGGAFRMTREGALVTKHTFRVPGTYVLRVRAWGEQCGDELPKLELKIDGESLKSFEVEALENQPDTYEHRLEISAGEKEISLGYLNNYRDEKFPEEGCDRNLGVNWLEIVGPGAPAIYPESHTRIFNKPITPETDKTQYASEIVERFAKQAFRRPLRTNELDRLMKFYDMAEAEGENFESSVKLVLQAILVSPHFLFRGESQPDPDNPEATHLVDEFALASRLSYFLWSSMPDAELFALAEKNRLRRNLDGQIKRMLRDPKSGAFVENFVGQWLQIRNLNFVQPDAKEFPEFDEELRHAMRKETELLFEHILRQDRSVVELLDAKYSFVNERLARHYGIKGLTGDKFQKVALNDTGRAGVLTHASVLTLTSNPNRTSPVKRGKYVLENILGTPPPPPPPDVPELKESDKEAPTGTLRDRMVKHRDDPNCSSCHARMDPIGFGLENFDGIGAWRKKEGEFEIDATGVLVSGEGFNGPAELNRILVEQKKDEFIRCLSEKMLTYALGRGLEFYDQCAVDDITKKLRSSNYKFSTLIRSIVDSTPFQKRRGEKTPH